MAAGSVRMQVDGSGFLCLCGGCSRAVSQGVQDKVERDAVPTPLKQQATAAPATNNSAHHAAEHVITYPSRLIYYLNQDFESAYHDLDTRVKNQATEGQVSQNRGGSYLDACCVVKVKFYIHIMAWVKQ